MVMFYFDHGITIGEFRIRHACGSGMISNESCMNRRNNSCEWNGRVLKIYFFCQGCVIYEPSRGKQASKNFPSSKSRSSSTIFSLYD